MAVNGRGDAIAVWAGPNNTVQASTRPAGGDWSVAQNLGDGGRGALDLKPEVAIDA